MVFVDLLSTIIAPVQTVYIVYLIYLVAAKGSSVPTTALIMLAAIYGLQAIIFIIHGAFEMVGWLVIYILAIPIFSLFIPVYSFWKMVSQLLIGWYHADMDLRMTSHGETLVWSAVKEENVR